MAAAILAVVGRLLSITGAVAYHRRPDPFWSVFGYHEVFHAGATCHYVVIALLVG